MVEIDNDGNIIPDEIFTGIDLSNGIDFEASVTMVYDGERYKVISINGVDC